MDSCGRVRGMVEIFNGARWLKRISEKSVRAYASKWNNPEADISLAKAGMACCRPGPRAVEKQTSLLVS